MSPIQDEITAYEAIQARLEAEHMGEWVLMRDRQQGRKLLEYHGPNIEVHIGLDPTWTKDQHRAPRADKTNLKAAIPGLIGRIHYPVVLGRTFLRDCLLTYDGRTGNASISVTPAPG